ncbi:MAG: choice-of-anchor D domain-containing protein [Verrucomicrobia bacterium]|nr:choice-of-anchor D domain-containing protein [Verrucomicrobiota bacterium]
MKTTPTAANPMVFRHPYLTDIIPLKRRLATGASCLLAAVVLSDAEPAGLDNTFGTGGVTALGAGTGDDIANAVAIQSDGKILVAGHTWNGANNDFLIGRFQNFGASDPYFGGLHATSVGSGEDYGRAIAVQSDGKVLVAGSTHNGTNYDFAVVRYLTDGSLDYTFGTLGRVTTPIGTGNDYARALTIQSDGRIVVAGYAQVGTTTDMAVARYLDTGVLDTAFSGDGKVTLGTTLTHEYGMSVAMSGVKVVVGGYAKVISSGVESFAIVRLASAGSADTSFNGTGAVSTNIGGTEDRAHAIAVQSDGKIVAAGYAVEAGVHKFALARYNTTGGLDGGFGVGGTVVTALGSGASAANAMLVQPDGKIVAAGEAVGSAGDFAVVRYLANGSVDPEFCGAGQAIVAVGTGADSANGVALQSDGNLVVAGSTHNGDNLDVAVVRLLGNPVPEIDIEFPEGSPLADGSGTVDFGDTTVGTGPRIYRDVTIRNTGSANLTGLFVSIDGPAAGDYLISQPASMTLAPGATATVALSFLPTAEGTRSATLHVASNDVNEGSFDLFLTGSGKVPPTITTTSPLPPGMVNTPYNLAFTATGGTPPYTWSVDSGVLPAGLTLSGPGMLVGTPSSVVNANFTVRVTGADGRASTLGCSLTIVDELNPGDPDPSFGGDGKVTTAVGTGNDSAQAVVVQPDGKVVVAGFTQIGGVEDFAVIRYLADGLPDSSFGAGGIVTTAVGTFRDYGRCVALQTDGKILVAGEVSNGGAYDFGVVRYLANGTPDPSFGTGGIVVVSLASNNDFPKGIFVRGDGKIVVAGAADINFGVVRLNANGSLDTSFGTTGKVVTDFGTNTFDYAEAALMQSDGKIIVAGRVSTSTRGYDFGLIRYQENGALDTTFGTSGKVATPVGGGTMEDICYDLAEQNDGRIIAVGDSVSGGSSIAVVRYTANGALDATFGSGGIGTYAISNAANHGRAVAVQNDGAIIVAGYANSQGNTDFFGGIRLLPDGAADSSFGVTGRLVTRFGAGPDRAYGIALQSAGGIVLAGEAFNGTNTDVAVARYVGPLAAEIVVEDQAGTPLVDGASGVDFGSAATSRVFTIRNAGTAALTGVHGDLDGANAADFTITQPATTVLVPGTAISFTVTFAPGASGARLASLHVISNDADEGSFDIGLAGGTAASPLLAWRLSHFGNADNSGIGADSYDYDKDGLANLLEYAFAGDPKAASPSIQPIMPPLGGGQRAIAFRCDASRTDITYTVQASATLAAGSWIDIARSTGGAATVPINGLGTVSDSGASLRVVTVTPVAGVFPAGRGFLRVKVSH